MTSLRTKAVSATIWTAVETSARQGVQFGTTLILARLLTPVDYGTIGLMAVFIGLAGVFINSGFSFALIQRPEVSNAELSSVFYFNFGVATLTGAGLAAAAGAIAAFYKVPVLEPLAWFLALDLILGSLGSVQRTLLVKSLNFRRQCVISLVALAVSSIVAIVLAFTGYGVWTLAWQTMAYTIVSTTLLWVLSEWRPSGAFSLAAIRSLFRFSSFLLISSIMEVLYTRLNTLVIGKFYSPADLGQYSRAENTSQLPGSFLTSILGSVAFPLFSTVQADKSLLKNGLRKAILLAMLINIPAMLGMMVAARPLVIVLFGEQWIPCVPYLQILCAAGILWPMHVLNLNVLIAQGHSQRFFRLEVAKKIVSIGLLGAACFFGVTAIAWSAVAAGAICYVINAYYSGQLLGYGAGAQLADLLPYAGVGTVMALSVAALAWVLPATPLIQLSGQVLVGAILYTVLCHTLRLPAFADALDLLKSSPLGRRVGGQSA